MTEDKLRSDNASPPQDARGPSVSIVKITWMVGLINLHLLIAAFCVFGLLATREPGLERVWIFRAGYGLGLVSSLAIAVLLAAKLIQPYGPRSISAATGPR